MVAQEPVVTFLVDKSGVVTLSGDFDVSRLGMAHKVESGHSIFEIYEDTPQVVHAFQKALLGEHVYLETRVNGLTFANSYSPLFDIDGNVTRVIGVSFNITESKKTEEILRNSEFRLRTLFNSASDAIFTMDNKTFIDCNEATLRIFHCKRDQIVGQTPFRFSPAIQPDGRSSE